mmetsp:Transcript_39533/g.125684  ORF Transcript_39533/g.125684 Transcript_39533/m.125684 type:complete len:263 (+) Transcript_39533:1185-1973(+)
MTLAPGPPAPPRLAAWPRPRTRARRKTWCSVVTGTASAPCSARSRCQGLAPLLRGLPGRLRRPSVSRHRLPAYTSRTPSALAPEPPPRPRGAAASGRARHSRPGVAAGARPSKWMQCALHPQICSTPGARRGAPSAASSPPSPCTASRASPCGSARCTRQTTRRPAARSCGRPAALPRGTAGAAGRGRGGPPGCRGARRCGRRSARPSWSPPRGPRPTPASPGRRSEACSTSRGGSRRCRRTWPGRGPAGPLPSAGQAPGAW